MTDWFVKVRNSYMTSSARITSVMVWDLPQNLRTFTVLLISHDDRKSFISFLTICSIPKTP